MQDGQADSANTNQGNPQLTEIPQCQNYERKKYVQRPLTYGPCRDEGALLRWPAPLRRTKPRSAREAYFAGEVSRGSNFARGPVHDEGRAPWPGKCGETGEQTLLAFGNDG